MIREDHRPKNKPPRQVRHQVIYLYCEFSSSVEYGSDYSSPSWTQLSSVLSPIPRSPLSFVRTTPGDSRTSFPTPPRGPGIGLSRPYGRRRDRTGTTFRVLESSIYENQGPTSRRHPVALWENFRTCLIEWGQVPSVETLKRQETTTLRR